jgi:hypothetical protein
MGLWIPKLGARHGSDDQLLITMEKAPEIVRGVFDTDPV